MPYPQGMTEPSFQRVEVDGLDCHVYSSTAHDVPDRPAFVLVHGIGMSHRYLSRLHRVLSEHGDTYSIVLPGFGSTSKPVSTMSITAYAELLANVLGGLGLGSSVLLGHSMGAQCVVELAVERPDLLSHVVLIGPAVDSAHKTVFRQALALGYNSLLEKLSLNAVQFADCLRCGPRWFLKELPVAMSYPLEERLQTVDHPVLIVRGARDPVALPLWCRRLTDAAKIGTLLEIPGHNHGVQHSGPDEVVAGVMGFVLEPGWSPARKLPTQRGRSPQ